jgi:S-adenosylmethionine:diacylglycerol 3-amino-3-carboxypropyl transferase
MPETLSSFEVLRIIVSLFGMFIGLRGRHNAHERQVPLRVAPIGETPVHQEERRMKIERAKLVEFVQTILCIIHVGFVVNGVVNGFYPSAGLEQLNVLTSNIQQVMAPLGMILISMRIDTQIEASAMSERLRGMQPGAPRWSYLRETYVSDGGDEPEKQEPTHT